MCNPYFCVVENFFALILLDAILIAPPFFHLFNLSFSFYLHLSIVYSHFFPLALDLIFILSSLFRTAVRKTKCEKPSCRTALISRALRPIHKQFLELFFLAPFSVLISSLRNVFGTRNRTNTPFSMLSHVSFSFGTISHIYAKTMHTNKTYTYTHRICDAKPSKYFIVLFV